MKWLLGFIPRPYIKIEDYQDGSTMIEPDHYFIAADMMDDTWCVSIVWMTPRKFKNLPEWNS